MATVWHYYIGKYSIPNIIFFLSGNVIYTYDGDTWRHTRDTNMAIGPSEKRINYYCNAFNYTI